MLSIVFPNINPVIVTFGALEIKWYGLAYLFGILFGYLIIQKIHSGIANSKKALDDLFVYSAVGIIIGGRLGYVVFYAPEFFLNSPLQILKTWEGGMSFHGGLMGLVSAIYFVCKKHQQNFFYTIDRIACVAPIGIFFGRIANFINAELYGRVTDAPWGIIFPGEYLPRHPSQLYEAATEGLLLFIIMMFLYNYTNLKNSYGRLSGLFLLFYGFFRISIENYREPDQQIGYFFNMLTMGQLLTFPMIILGICLFLKNIKI